MPHKRSIGILISSLLSFCSKSVNLDRSYLSSVVKNRCTQPMKSLNFDNRNFRELPIDKSNINQPRQVSNAIFSVVSPSPVNNPKLVAVSRSALSLLGIDSLPHDEVLADYFSGNSKLTGSETTAHCYCGYQFGSFAGQLGDGAAISLGEIVNPQTSDRWEIQLKGAGVTPYSRSADGRKVLRSTIREFLASEAMHFLNIPTTRAGTCVTSDTTVARDPYYDGRIVQEKCTIVSRIAPNFFRFGSFEIFKSKAAGAKGDYDRAGPSAGNLTLKKQLLDHILKYYPEYEQESDVSRYDDLFEEIVRRTAKLIARWQSVGFVHGVMNTDNMSIMGLTIDYGPYGFMEYFDPGFVPNGSDSTARYSYAQQPSIGKWNVRKLSEAFAPYLDAKRSEESIKNYDEYLAEEYMAIMRSKLGLLIPHSEDEQLLKEMFDLMKETMIDFTDMFVAFSEFQRRESNHTTTSFDNKALLLENLLSRCASPASIIQIMEKKQRIHRLSMQPSQIQQLYSLLQENQNPELLSKVFGDAPIDLIRDEIFAEKKNLDILLHTVEMVKKCRQTTVESKRAVDSELWSSWLEKYVARLQKDAEMISMEMMEEFQASLSGDETDIASKEIKQINRFLAKKRVAIMEKVNPTFVLRNWILQQAIEEAEKENFHDTQVLLSMIETPFRRDFVSFFHTQNICGNARQEEKEFVVTEDEKKFLAAAPAGSDSLYCTCSS